MNAIAIYMQDWEAALLFIYFVVNLMLYIS